MLTTTIYAITAGGVLGATLFYHLTLVAAPRLKTRFIFWFLKHLVSPFLSRRRRFLPLLTRAQFLLQLAYWIGTLFCIMINVEDINAAGSRAGTLAVIQFLPLFFGSHLSFAADLLGVSLPLWRHFQGSVGVLACALGVFHIISILPRDHGFSFRNKIQLWGFVVS